MAPRPVLWLLIGLAVVAATTYGAAVAGHGDVNKHAVVMLHHETIVRHSTAIPVGGGQPIATRLTNLNIDYVHPDIETPGVDVFPDTPLFDRRPATQERMIAAADPRIR